ncbi:MAG: hypothetical protein Q8P67_23270 [archaeon]|nr:hypothetical protein [archaeon]
MVCILLAVIPHDTPPIVISCPVQAELNQPKITQPKQQQPQPQQPQPQQHFFYVDDTSAAASPLSPLSTQELFSIQGYLDQRFNLTSYWEMDDEEQNSLLYVFLAPVPKSEYNAWKHAQAPLPARYAITGICQGRSRQCGKYRLGPLPLTVDGSALVLIKTLPYEKRPVSGIELTFFERIMRQFWSEIIPLAQASWHVADYDFFDWQMTYPAGYQSLNTSRQGWCQFKWASCMLLSNIFLSFSLIHPVPILSSDFSFLSLSLSLIRFKSFVANRA